MTNETTIYLVRQVEDHAIVAHCDTWIEAQVECTSLCEEEEFGYYIDSDSAGTYSTSPT